MSAPKIESKFQNSALLLVEIQIILDNFFRADMVKKVTSQQNTSLVKI